jgi:hypothetical protein
MVPNQTIVLRFYVILKLIHNIKQPYHTSSYFETSLSRTKDKSVAYSFNPFIIRLIFCLIDEITQLGLTDLFGGV